jgi:ParB family chromosome partitioning protein
MEIELRYEALRARNPRRETSLLASLALLGQISPVVVVPEGERFVLIDGYKRVRALGTLRHDTTLAIAWSLTEPEALLFERLLRTGDADSAIEQGWFLREMHLHFGLSQLDLARRIGRTQSWVSRRIALVSQLPESVQVHVRHGAIGAHAAMKFLIPMARANAEAFRRLGDAIAPEAFSDREVGTLYEAWVTGTPKARELVLTAPRIVLLRARAEAACQPTPPKIPLEALLDDLHTAIARCAHGRLRDGVTYFRYRASPATRGDDIGFRCAREPG